MAFFHLLWPVIIIVVVIIITNSLLQIAIKMSYFLHWSDGVTVTFHYIPRRCEAGAWRNYRGLFMFRLFQSRHGEGRLSFEFVCAGLLRYPLVFLASVHMIFIRPTFAPSIIHSPVQWLSIKLQSVLLTVGGHPPIIGPSICRSPILATSTNPFIRPFIQSIHIPVHPSTSAAR